MNMWVKDVGDDEDSAVTDEEGEETADDVGEGIARTDESEPRVELAGVKILGVEKEAEVTGVDVGQTSTIPVEGTSDVTGLTKKISTF